MRYIKSSRFGLGTSARQSTMADEPEREGHTPCGHDSKGRAGAGLESRRSAQKCAQVRSLAQDPSS